MAFAEGSWTEFYAASDKENGWLGISTHQIGNGKQSRYHQSDSSTHLFQEECSQGTKCGFVAGTLLFFEIYNKNPACRHSDLVNFNSYDSEIELFKQNFFNTEIYKEEHKNGHFQNWIECPQEHMNFNISVNVSSLLTLTSRHKIV